MTTAQAKSVAHSQVLSSVKGWAQRHKALVPYALAVFWAIVVKFPILNNNIIFIDEPSYLNEAALVDSPQKFLFSFVYLSETKFPLGLFPYIAALWLNHAQAILLLHIFGTVAVAASCVLLLALSRRAFGSFWPGALAALEWGIFLNRNDLTVAVLLEYFQVPLILGSLLVLAVWAKKYSSEAPGHLRHLLPLVGAGALAGAAALVKPPGIVILPLLAVGAYFALGSSSLLRKRLLVALAPLVGGALPIGVTLLPYLFWAQARDALLFNIVDLSTQYASYQYEGSITHRLASLLRDFNLIDVCVLGIALFGHVLIYTLTRKRWTRVDRLENTFRLVILGSGLGLLVGYSSGQTKDNYLIAILPALSLYAWSVITLGYRWFLNPEPPTANHIISSPRILPRIAYSLLWVVLIINGSQAYVRHYLAEYSPAEAGGREYASTGLPGVDPHTLAAAIAARTHPGDSIWVYYNAPEIYWMANRKPATDDPEGTWLVDYYDQFWFERTLHQLQHDHPTLIVGFDDPRYPRAWAATVEDLPLIGTYLKSAYSCTQASPSDVGGPAGVVFCSLRHDHGP